MPVLTESPVDLTKYESAFDVVDNGRYLARVSKVPTVSVSKGAKTAGATSVGVQFSSEDYVGLTFDNFILHESTYWKWRQFLVAVGVSEGVLTGTEEFDTDDLLGMECYITVGTQPERPNPNGGVYKARNIITKYEPANTGASWAGI